MNFTDDVVMAYEKNLYEKVCDFLKSSSNVYTLEEVLNKFDITIPTAEEMSQIYLAFDWASQALFQYMEDSPVKTKLLLEAKLRDIHYLVGCVLHEDNSRNYGDRDAFLHKLNNAWEKFIELHPTSLDPCLCSQRNLVKLSVEGT